MFYYNAMHSPNIFICFAHSTHQEFVAPVCLPFDVNDTDVIQYGKVLKLAGWGFMDQFGSKNKLSID